MGRNLLVKLGVIVAVVVASVVLAVPPREKVHLGLDLQGGLHLLLEVQVDKAIERALERRAEALRKELVAKGQAVVAVEPNALQGLRMVFSKPPDKSVVEEVVRIQDPVGEVRQQTPEVWLYNVPADELQHFRTSAVDQALEKIRNRIDAFGVSEPSISREGTQRIVVQLPGLTDTKRAIDLIGKTAQLELKLVQSQAASSTATPPPGTQLLFMKKKDPRTAQLVDAGAYFVERRAAVSGDMLADARAVPDQTTGQYYVLMRLDSRGRKIFERVTREHVGRAMAIVLDDTIFSAPVIQEPIPGGEARITGNFTPEEARDLAIVLREGALPAPVTIVENRTVGPSLGSDSIAQGIRAAVLGATLVVLFMLVYYRLSGLIAIVALLLNMVIVMGVLALPGLGATLTLPGIAGIILTLGMAVDANVLIFERIREELEGKKPIRAAVSAGFDRAFSAILDSNVTTVIAALVLFQFGTGPVKGFAVTLTIGIAVSMFTAIFVSKTIFETIFHIRRVTNLRLSMLRLIPANLHIDFLGKAKLCITISVVVILIGLASMVSRGGLTEGIDFSGGTLLQLRFSQPVDLGEVRDALAEVGLAKSIVQHFGDQHEVLIRTGQPAGPGEDPGQQAQKALQSRFTGQTVELRRMEVVGAQVSADLRRQALFALFYAILGTVVYLSGRFEGKWGVALTLAAVLFTITYGITQWFPGVSPSVLIVVALVVSTVFGLVLNLRYAQAAIVAIYHDVLVTVGFLSLFNVEFDLQIIAALLTIIGYSLNDTIVIFDRIRENLRGQRREAFAKVVNDSVNQTLSRTLLTTGHTLLAVMALFLLGGEVLHSFALALLVGMISGTYSTVYIAGTMLVYWDKLTAHLRASISSARAHTLGPAKHGS